MVELQPNNLGIGLLFPYEQATDPKDLKAWAEEHGFKVQEEHGEIGVGMGPDGLLVRGPGPFATKNNIHILYNPSADLKGYAESSFITFKDDEGGDFGSVSNSLNEFLESFDGIEPRDIEQHELTYNGKVRISRGEHDISAFYDQSHLDTVSELGAGSGAKGVVSVFESETESATDDGWFAFILDSREISNPRLWSYKLTRRYDPSAGIKIDNIKGTIENIVDRTTGEN